MRSMAASTSSRGDTSPRRTRSARPSPSYRSYSANVPADVAAAVVTRKGESGARVVLGTLFRYRRKRKMRRGAHGGHVRRARGEDTDRAWVRANGPSRRAATSWKPAIGDGLTAAGKGPPLAVRVTKCIRPGFGAV